ncbi:MAG: DsbE family thiol:disulfide interchange protein [Alphaproteobacteria bacterium]|nr:DsbE family thiol:disulfide interchange protein [Alphaproteobacteria bacterium]
MSNVSRSAAAAGWLRLRCILWALVPLVLFAAVGGFLYQGLYLKPRELPSALLGRPAPAFDLPPLPGKQQFRHADLKGEVSLVNIFASWCAACRVEHPLLMRLAEDKVLPVYGFNYKDDSEAALGWLKRFGDPYGRIAVDRTGRTGIDWGVYGVPESFLVDREGRIVCKHIGPVMERDLAEKLRPAIAAARAGQPVKC